MTPLDLPAFLCCQNCNTPFIPPLPFIPGQDDSGTSPKMRLSSAGAFEVREFLEQRISQLESLLSSCRLAKSHLDQILDPPAQPPSSHHTLPAEIWVEIFKIASELNIDKDDLGHIFTSASMRAAPLNIASVCFSWRNLAVKTPSLWTNLEFTIPKHLPESKIMLLSTFLARSRHHPLSIAVQMHSDSPYFSMPADSRRRLGDLLAIVASHSYRWQDALFKLSSSVYDLDVFPIQDASLLESLAISTEDCLPYEDDWKPLFIERAPLLAEFLCRNFRPSFESFQRMIPWVNLRAISLGEHDDAPPSYTLQNFLHVIKSCPRLEKFRVYGDFLETSILDDEDEIVHPNLKFFSMIAVTSDILSILTLPNLRQLSLSQLYWNALDQTDVTEFIARTKSIEEFRLVDSPTINICELLPKRSSIRRLQLKLATLERDPPVSDDLKELVDQWQDLLPRLEYVKLVVDLFCDQPNAGKASGVLLVHAVQHLVASLFENGVSLRLVLVTPTIDDLSLASFVDLKELDLEGIEIEFVNEYSDTDLA